MGNKTLLPPLAEAQRLCPAKEWDEFSAGFDRVASETGKIDCRSFCTHVLGSSLPFSVSERLFELLSNGHKHLSKKDFLSAIAFMKYGQAELKIQILFALYDEDGSGGISKRECNKYLQLLPTDSESVKELSAAFEQSDKERSYYSSGWGGELSFKCFRAWATSHMTAGRAPVLLF
jgi:Ca2+-binding EF-hand superfamily protein